MRLLFNGEGRYPDFDDGYQLYVNRSRGGPVMDRRTYARVVRSYCKALAERLCEDGAVTLPCGLGIISAAMFRRKARYKDGKFAGFGAMDWKTGHRDGSIKAFGLAYLPRQDKKQNLRCYGFVGNRRLFQRMKEIYETTWQWTPIEFRDELI